MKALFYLAFLGDQGLRSGWRWVFHGMGLMVVTGVALGSLVAGSLIVSNGLGSVDRLPESVWLLVGYGVVVSLWVLWTWASGALFDREGATSSGLGGPLWVSAREMAQGIAVGFFLLLPALFIMGTGASFSIQFSAFRLAGVANFLILSLTLLLAATAEELVFRGYGFLWLCRSLANGLDGLFGWFGWGGGRPKKLAWSLGLAGPTLVFAVVFGLLHMGNEGHTHLATLNTVLAGLWLTVALFRSRAMWMPIGLHFGWNWGQGLFFGLPVSGNGGEGDAIVLSSPMTLSFDGVEWIAGGTYGVEGSVGCTVALLMGCLIAGAGPRRSASHQMAALRPKRVGGSTP